MRMSHWKAITRRRPPRAESKKWCMGSVHELPLVHVWGSANVAHRCGSSAKALISLQVDKNAKMSRGRRSPTVVELSKLNDAMRYLRKCLSLQTVKLSTASGVCLAADASGGGFSG
jgi:hypothetical protein